MYRGGECDYVSRVGAELRDMEDYRDYRCPKECSGRSKDCHIACERHEKYRELNAKRLKAEHDEQLTITEALRKKLNKTAKTRYTKTMGD